MSEFDQVRAQIAALKEAHKAAQRAARAASQETDSPTEEGALLAKAVRAQIVRREADKIEDEIRLLEEEAAALDELEKARRRARMLALDAREVDDQAFWFRRFMVSLQIGNGAAFLGLTAGLLQADKDIFMIVGALAWAPATFFGSGVVASGALPGLLAWRASLKPDAQRAQSLVRSAILFCTTAAAGMFIAGVVFASVEIFQIHQETIARIDAAQAAASKPGRAKAAQPSPSTTQAEP